MKNSSIETYVKILAIGTLLFYQTHVSAQSALIGTLPMQVNPAFAGAAGSPRLGTSGYLVSSRSLSSITGLLHKYNRQNFAFSYDNFIPKISTGIGIHGSYTRRINDGWYRSQAENMQDLELGLSIAPKFSFKGKYTLSPAVEVNASFKKTNYEHLSQKLEPVNTSIIPQVRLGLAFNARKFYIGLAYHIETSGNYIGKRIFDMDGNMSHSTSLGWYLQMGYNFQRREDSKFSFSPQIIYGRPRVRDYYAHRYDSNISMLLNLTFRYRQIIWGTTYDAGYEGVRVMVGWQKKNFRIAYLHVGGSSFNGQISFRYIFNTKMASDLNKNINY